MHARVIHVDPSLCDFGGPEKSVSGPCFLYGPRTTRNGTVCLQEVT